MKAKVLYSILFLFIFLIPTWAAAAVNLVVDANPDPVRPLEQVNVDFTVTNTGPGTITNVELVLTYPANLNQLNPAYATTGGSANTVVCTGGGGTTNCVTGDTATWTLGDLAAGEGVSVNIVPVVSGATPDGTMITFDAEVLVSSVQQATASDTVQVLADPFFELVVDKDTDPVTTSGNREYTLKYSNVSTVSSGTQLTFPIPAGTSFVSATGGGTLSGGDVVWNLGSVDGGTGGEQRVTVNTAATVGDVITVDSALISGTDSGSTLHEVQAGNVRRVEDGDRPGLFMTVNPDPVRPGEQLNVELTVTNPGTTLLSNVEILLRYPENLNQLNPTFATKGAAANTLVCTNGGNTTNCVSGDIGTWSLGDLPAGEGITVNMWPVVESTADDGTLIQFEAEVRVDGVQQTLSSKTALVITDPFFEMYVDEETDPVSTTGNREYTVSYGNVATDSTSTQLIFPLPVGTNFVSATGGGTLSGGEVVWNLGSLPGGMVGEERVIVNVAATAGDVLKVDPARLSGMDSGSVFHEVRAGKITRVEDTARPILDISLNPDPVSPTEQLNVELTVTNPGATPITNVEILLHYPEHLNGLNPIYMTTGGAANTVVCTNFGASLTCFPSDLATWTLGNLAAGEGITVSLRPIVSGSTADGTLIPFKAEVRVDGVQQAITNRTAHVMSAPLFELTVNEETDPVTPTGNREYTIIYGNASADDASSTQLSMPLPAGTTFVSATGGGHLDLVLNEIIWQLKSVLGGAGGERRVTVSVGVSPGEVVKVDPVRIRGMRAGSVVHETRARRTTRVKPGSRPDLAVSFNPYPVSPSEQLNVELTLTNTGATTLSNVELLLLYPEHLNSLNPALITTGAPANTVDCTNALCLPGDIVTWDLNNLLPGESVTVTMPPTVTPSTDLGTVIPFEAEVRVSGLQLGSATRSAFVGTASAYDTTGDKMTCFPVKAVSGKIAIICM